MSNPKNRPAAGRTITDVSPDLTVAAAPPRKWYWLGALPSLLASSVCVGGQCFARTTQTVRRADSAGDCVRTPRAGDVVALSEDQVERIGRSLRRRVVRLVPASDAGRQCHVTLAIPDPDDIEAARALGRAVPSYVPRPGDEPLSKHIYCIPCDEVNPKPRDIDSELPPSIADTGLVWPGGDPLPLDAHLDIDDGKAAVAASFSKPEGGFIKPTEPNPNPLLR